MQTTNLLIRKRIILLFLIGIALFLVLMGRLGWLQLIQGDRLRAEALDIRTRDVPVEAKRGAILDRNGNELATSVSVDSVYAFPPQIKKDNKRKTADMVAEALGMDKEDVYKKLTEDVGFVWLMRRIDYESSEKLRALKADEANRSKGLMDGIELVEESKRFYRQDALAAHLLGFVGDDNQGLTGFESTYDDELRGKPGHIIAEKDAVGRSIPEAVHKYIPPVTGNNLVLTIDQTIQFFVERELDKIVDTYHPKLAVIILMNPKNGEILAMGSRPSFNPGNWQDYPQSIWDHNPAVGYNYEPGSTFKIITAASAMQEGAVHLGDTFYDPGFISVMGRTIQCWADGGHGAQNFPEVCQNSCNPGFVTIGLRLGKDKFYNYINAFGLTQETGINLPGEEVGIQRPKDEATDLDIATMSIGQSIAVTPVQLICATSAVANEGVLLKPKLIKAITDPDGKVLKEFKTEQVRQVLSKDTAQTLMQLLTDVVRKGTGKNAFVDGYGAAGKTGTAQVVGPGGYVDGKYVASFMGFAPADDPEIAALVMVAEPSGGNYFGSQVAAPAFKAIALDTLRYLRVPERSEMEKPAEPFTSQEKISMLSIPNVVNYPVEDAQRVLKNAGCAVKLSGQGYLVSNQVPAAGAIVFFGTAVLLELQENDSLNEVVVPDLRGLTMKEVGGLLEKLGLVLNPIGSGLAVEQETPPGTKVLKGATVNVEFGAGFVQTLPD